MQVPFLPTMPVGLPNTNAWFPLPVIELKKKCCKKFKKGKRCKKCPANLKR